MFETKIVIIISTIGLPPRLEAITFVMQYWANHFSCTLALMRPKEVTS